jgi:hypothetical protein
MNLGMFFALHRIIPTRMGKTPISCICVLPQTQWIVIPMQGNFSFSPFRLLREMCTSSRRVLPLKHKPVILPAFKFSKINPHSHGENAMWPSEHHGWSGSSPLAWGKLLSAPSVQNPAGIIPTRMGKTTTQALHVDWRGDYPHSHGETPISCICVLP